jgi:hypothetical protein
VNDHEGQPIDGLIDDLIHKILDDAGARGGLPRPEPDTPLLERVLLAEVFAESLADAIAPALARALAPKILQAMDSTAEPAAPQ